MRTEARWLTDLPTTQALYRAGRRTQCYGRVIMSLMSRGQDVAEPWRARVVLVGAESSPFDM